MERKAGSASVAVSAAEVKAALPRAKGLTSEEEKTLRMRYGGAAADLRDPLPRAAGDNEELGDELLLMEMQLLRSFRARGMVKGPMAVARPANTVRNAAKDKIVRGLRKKR
jgi:hypothetical protein